MLPSYCLYNGNSKLIPQCSNKQLKNRVNFNIFQQLFSIKKIKEINVLLELNQKLFQLMCSTFELIFLSRFENKLLLLLNMSFNCQTPFVSFCSFLFYRRRAVGGGPVFMPLLYSKSDYVPLSTIKYCF